MFKAEGTYDVTVTRAILGEAKFCQDAGAFDVCIEVQDANGAANGPTGPASAMRRTVRGGNSRWRR